MQDQYACDVGDFGKYGMLRSLFHPPCKLGVVWCLYPDESHKSDGRHVAYLGREDFRRCDAALFDRLKQMVAGGRRSVGEIERSGLLGEAVCFPSPLDFAKLRPAERVAARKKWLEEALARTKTCDAVFFDPDNGLEIASCKRSSKAAGKFIYLDELRPFVQRKQVVIVYHHLCRRHSHLDQIHQRRHQLRRLGCSGEVIALRFRSYSPRVYFIITTQTTHQRTTDAIARFLDSPWRNYFSDFASD